MKWGGDEAGNTKTREREVFCEDRKVIIGQGKGKGREKGEPKQSWR